MAKQQSGKRAKSRQHSAHKMKYERQRMRTAKNKEKARKQHLLLHPNDKKAAKDISTARNVL